jgi:hypothetical protein
MVAIYFPASIKNETSARSNAYTVQEACVSQCKEAVINTILHGVT